MKAAKSAVMFTRADKHVYLAMWTVLSIALTLTLALSCTASDKPVPPTLTLDPPLKQSEAIDIAKASLNAVIEDIEFAGYEQIRVRVGVMRLSKLQELTKSELYSPDSPRMQRQIWAVQIGGTFPDDANPYRVDHGYGVVGVDAINGDIHLRARYDQEILVEP